MDRVSAMQIFVRVVETGSFSAVARERQSTQSAISKQVAALEKLLGARLLSRSTRSLAVTEEGERYFEQARRLVAEIAEAESTLFRGEQQLTGWLRLASSGAFGRLKLLPVVETFQAAHPEVKIDLRLNDAFVDLVEQGIDMAVRIGELAQSNLVARRVGTTGRALVATPAYLRQLPKGLPVPRAPQDLAHHNCIVYTDLATRNVWSFTAGPGAAAPAGTIQEVRVQGSLQTNSSEIVRAAVLSGHGIGYSPTWMFDTEIAAGRLKVLMPDWPAPSLPINVVSPMQRRYSAKVKAFSEYLASALSKTGQYTGRART